MRNRLIRSHGIHTSHLLNQVPLMLLILGISLSPMTSQVQGQEEETPPTSEESKEAAAFYQFYRFYQSKWQVEKQTEGKEKETFNAECFGSAGGCNVYVGKGETSIWGYNPKTRQWTGTGQLENGSRYVMAISRPPGPKFVPGMTFTFTGTIWHADGKVNYVTNKSTCVDKDTIHEVTTGTDQDGKATPKVTITLKRLH